MAAGLRLGPGQRLLTIPATELAREYLGRPLPNTALLGAVAAATGVVTLASVRRAIVDRFDARGRLLLVGQQCGQPSHAVSRHLRDRAVRVVQAHPGAAATAFEEDETVCPDSGHPRAHAAREVGDIDVTDAGHGGVEEIVAVRVGFPEMHRHEDIGSLVAAPVRRAAS